MTKIELLFWIITGTVLFYIYVNIAVMIGKAFKRKNDSEPCARCGGDVHKDDHYCENCGQEKVNS